MELSAAEIQLLASLAKAHGENLPTDRTSLEVGGKRFWVFREDWSTAYGELAARGLIEGNDTGYGLTEAGMPLAREFHRQRPDMYWYYYQKFYQAARASDAHSGLCRRAFGEDLCQEGQTDMAALADLLALLDLKPGERLLDLGCGAGVIAEYIADRTGAIVTGLDYAGPAVDEANRRTASKRRRMEFIQGDMNNLDLPDSSYDAIVSLDTLYWVADLEEFLPGLIAALKPGGQMGIFMNHHIGEGDDPAGLAPEHADLSRALAKLQMPFDTVNFTANICAFWPRIYKAAVDLQSQFEAEGNGFIADSLIRESLEEYLPDVESGRIARYLFHIRP